MAIPGRYSEESLASFMHTTLGATAGLLGLQNPGSYAEAVNNVALACGAEIGEVGDAAKLRCLAAREAWRLAAGQAAVLSDFSADGATYNRAQARGHIQAELDKAEWLALGYLGFYRAQATEIVPAHDPYTIDPDDVADGYGC